jgi:hypothetical protein
MTVRLDAKTFEKRVDDAHKEIVVAKTGKLLSTKVELKEPGTKTMGDRFSLVERILTKLGINFMSRTNEKDAAKSLKKYAIDNKDFLSTDLKRKLTDLVDALKTKAEDSAKDKDKVKVKKEFDDIKADITKLEVKKTWEKGVTPSMKANDFQHTAGELLGVDSTEKAKLDKFCKDNKEFAKPEVLGAMLGRIVSSKSLGDKLQEYIEVLVDNGATLDVKHAKTQKTPLETYQAAHAGNINNAIVALLTKK